MEKKEQTKKLVNRGIIVVCSAIILFIAIDLLNILAFKGKPFIIINETDTKQSSILYDIYECNEERIFKLKGTKFACPKENKKIITITDRSEGEDCAQAIEYYYKDYYFTCIKSQSVIVTVNGKEYTIKEALNNGIVTMDELIAIGFKPLKKNVTDEPEPTEPTNPTNPTKPSNPTDPTTPTEPTNPTKPVTPGEPITPIEPIEKPIDNTKKITITDTSAGKDCAQAIEYYYKRYYFNCIKSQYVIVTVNGKKYNIKEALNNGIVTMDELIDAGFKPQTDAVDR